MEKTFVMIKPDAMQKSLAFEVFSRLEKAGLKPVAMKMLKLDDVNLDVHYAHHADKSFFNDLKTFMKESPVIASVWEGENAVTKVRELIGATNPEQASAGTVRHDYGENIQRNLVHASDGPDTAKEEIGRFFNENEVINW
ncbi:nucleoside-diphosphate kinase [archaeon]|nr:nucleoside-diphosphate kinase [archaeon]